MELRSEISPYVLAMLICDQVITDAQTSKKSLIGIYDQILCPTFPTTQQISIYARLIDAEGMYSFRVQLVRVEHDQEVMKIETNPVRVPDRLQPYDVVIQLPFVIPGPGMYEFRLFANNAYLARATFTANALPNPAGGR